MVNLFTENRFVGAKPREEITARDLKRIMALQDTKKLNLQIKDDGYGTYVPIVGGSVHLFSRLNTAWTGKFPFIEDELRSMGIPSGTILCGESTVTDTQGKHDPHLFGRFARTNRAGSILLQKGFNPSKLALFDVLVHKGRDVSREPYRNRFDIVQNICLKATRHVSLIRQLDMPFDEANAYVKRMGLEGIIARDLDAGTAFTIDGNSAEPPRPDGCWKKKPFQEADFIATGWIPSTSKTFKGLVRDFTIAQYDSRTGELVDWGVCGIGLTREQKEKYADDSMFPLVVQIQFEMRTKNNKLQKASIMRIRDDKRPEECRYPPLPLAA